MSLENSQVRQLEESMSALLDNEADELEIRRLLKNAPQNKGLEQTWRRFNLVSAVLHQEEVAPVSEAASARIFAAIAAEETYNSDANIPIITPVGRVLSKGFARMAVAASVAIVAFVTLQSLVDTQVGTAPVAVQNAPASTTVQVADSQSSTVVFDAAAQQRLNDYIDRASIQYGDSSSRPQFNIFEDSQLIRQVNQIEP